MSVVFLLTQVLFAHSAETSIWAERRKALPSAAMTFLPPLGQVWKDKTQGSDDHRKKSFSALLPFGTIQKIQNPIQKPQGTVIYIQDVHGHLEAQKNISQIILKIWEQHPSAHLGLEGAEGRFSTESYRQFSPDMNKKMGSFLFNENLITGAEYAGFVTPENPTIIGVEDAKSYLENVAAIKKALPLQNEELKVIDLEKNILGIQKEKVYSPQLLELDQKWESYQNGNLSIGDYLTALTLTLSEGIIEIGVPSPFRERVRVRVPESISLFLKTWQLEKTLNFEKAERERNQFLSQLVEKLNKSDFDFLMAQSQLLRMGEMAYPDYYAWLKKMALDHGVSLNRTPEFDKYIHYVLQANAIDAQILLSEMSQFEKEVWLSLCKTENQKILVKDFFHLHLQEKLVKLILTPSEWDNYKKDVLGQGESVLSTKVQERRTSLSSFEDFYKFAEARDEKMVNNFFKNVLSTKNQELSTPLISILVTGGFHSSGISDLLLKKNFTVVTVTPHLHMNNQRSFDDQTQGNEYLNVFTREKTPLEKLFEAPQISLVETLRTNPIPGTGISPLNKSEGYRNLKLFLEKGWVVQDPQSGEWIATKNHSWAKAGTKIQDDATILSAVQREWWRSVFIMAIPAVAAVFLGPLHMTISPSFVVGFGLLASGIFIVATHLQSHSLKGLIKLFVNSSPLITLLSVLAFWETILSFNQVSWSTIVAATLTGLVAYNLLHFIWDRLAILFPQLGLAPMSAEVSYVEFKTKFRNRFEVLFEAWLGKSGKRGKTYLDSSEEILSDVLTLNPHINLEEATLVEIKGIPHVIYLVGKNVENSNQIIIFEFNIESAGSKTETTINQRIQALDNPVRLKNYDCILTPTSELRMWSFDNTVRDIHDLVTKTLKLSDTNHPAHMVYEKGISSFTPAPEPIPMKGGKIPRELKKVDEKKELGLFPLKISGFRQNIFLIYEDILKPKGDVTSAQFVLIGMLLHAYSLDPKEIKKISGFFSKDSITGATNYLLDAIGDSRLDHITQEQLAAFINRADLKVSQTQRNKYLAVLPLLFQNKQSGLEIDRDQFLDSSILYIGLTFGVHRQLVLNGTKTVRDIVVKSSDDWKEVANIGNAKIKIIEECLQRYGLKIRMTNEEILDWESAVNLDGGTWLDLPGYKRNAAWIETFFARIMVPALIFIFSFYRYDVGFWESYGLAIGAATFVFWGLHILRGFSFDGKPYSFKKAWAAMKSRDVLWLTFLTPFAVALPPLLVLLAIYHYRIDRSSNERSDQKKRIDFYKKLENQFYQSGLDRKQIKAKREKMLDQKMDPLMFDEAEDRSVEITMNFSPELGSFFSQILDRIKGQINGKIWLADPKDYHITLSCLISPDQKMTNISQDYDTMMRLAMIETLSYYRDIHLVRPRLQMTTNGAVIILWDVEGDIEAARSRLLGASGKVLADSHNGPRVIVHTTIAQIFSEEEADYSAEKKMQLQTILDEVNAQLLTKEIKLPVVQARYAAIYGWLGVKINELGHFDNKLTTETNALSDFVADSVGFEDAKTNLEHLLLSDIARKSSPNFEALFETLKNRPDAYRFALTISALISYHQRIQSIYTDSFVEELQTLVRELESNNSVSSLITLTGPLQKDLLKNGFVFNGKKIKGEKVQYLQKLIGKYSQLFRGLVRFVARVLGQQTVVMIHVDDILSGYYDQNNHEIFRQKQNLIDEIIYAVKKKTPIVFMGKSDLSEEKIREKVSQFIGYKNLFDSGLNVVVQHQGGNLIHPSKVLEVAQAKSTFIKNSQIFLRIYSSDPGAFNLYDASVRFIFFALSERVVPLALRIKINHKIEQQA
ncbi:MAG: hypothetical protein ACKVQC_09440 [Elusimicrobiota bacterium]